jgi:HPt (histidine-containing phosphotransfer) domain-containing protein
MNEQKHDEKAAAVRVRMSQLAAKFLNRTEVDIATLREALNRLAAGDVGAAGDIRHLAHRMVGTGATLGFKAISECAYKLEQLAESCLSAARLDEASGTRLAEALNALDSEFRKQRAH